MCLCAELGEDFEIGAGGFGDQFGSAGVDGGEVDEVTAYAEGAGTGAEEVSGSLQSDAAGGNELEVREWG